MYQTSLYVSQHIHTIKVWFNVSSPQTWWMINVKGWTSVQLENWSVSKMNDKTRCLMNFVWTKLYTNYFAFLISITAFNFNITCVNYLSIKPFICIASSFHFCMNFFFTSWNNSLNVGMKVALSFQDSPKFKFDMLIHTSLRFYCISSFILSIPVAEYYHTY